MKAKHEKEGDQMSKKYTSLPKQFSYSKNADVKCPFFISRGELTLHCESLIKDGYHNIMTFDNKSKCNKHRKKYCANTYRECPIYEQIMKKDSY